MDWQKFRSSVGSDGYGLVGYDRLRCIFVHIPKCGGISVSQALFGSLGGGHLTVRTYRRIFGRRDFSRYFKFTIVRNPWDRLTSAYRFLAAGGHDKWDQAWAREHLHGIPDFKTFVRERLTPDHMADELHLRPQMRFILDRHGRNPLDFIGRFETLADDFAFVCDRLGVSAVLPRLNVSRTPTAPDYRTLYDEETRAIASRIYAEDIDLLGYEF